MVLGVFIVATLPLGPTTGAGAKKGPIPAPRIFILCALVAPDPRKKMHLLRPPRVPAPLSKGTCTKTNTKQHAVSNMYEI